MIGKVYASFALLIRATIDCLHLRDLEDEDEFGGYNSFLSFFFPA